MSATRSEGRERAVFTRAGVVVGVESDGLARFLGIPFAAPPVGERRFAAPRSVVPWSGAWRAGRFGSSPIQPASPYLAGIETAEDCLSLNVWAPADAEGAPVLLWIYGGGFVAGTSAAPLFDGARLARESGAIVVSANHRTGVLGFALLTHRGLPEAANLGLQDVVATLRWIADEIASFGGDPGRVTVMGQSSGAFIAAALLTAPGARDLFARLLLVSGGPSRIVPRGQAERLADQFAVAADAAEPAQLRALPVEKLLAAQRRVGSSEIGARNGPVPESLGVVVDGRIVQAHPMEALRDGSRSDIPLLLLVAGAEVASLRGPVEGFAPASEADLVREIGRWGAPRPEAIVAAYRDVDLATMRERVLTDYIYRLPAARAARAHVGAGGRAWLAQIDEPDGAPGTHDLPVQVLFGNLPDDDRRAGLSALVRRTVCGFVAGGSAEWPEFRTPSDAVRLTREMRQIPNAFGEMLQLWEGTPRP